MARFTSAGGNGSGAPGPQGPAGQDGEGLNFRGEWVTDTLYLQNDIVTQNGSTYIANYDYQDTDGPYLDGDLWAPLALKGEPGLNGDPLDFLAVPSNIVPTSDNDFTLGTPENRWAGIHVGPGTIYITDQTLLTDAELTVNNGVLQIDGANQLQVGQLKFVDNTIESTTGDTNIQIGLLSSNADVIVNRDLVLGDGKTLIFPDNTVQTTAYTGGGGASDIADFVFTAEEGQSTISLPGDRQMRIQSGEDSDLYLTAGDDLYIQTLGFGDDIWVQAADDIRFTAGRENIEEGGRSYGWTMNSEGEFHLPENGYISNPYATVVTSGNRSATYTDSYLNNQSGIIDQNGVALPVDIDSTWFVNNAYSGIFTSPVVISFADGDSTTAAAIYDATSQGTPAVIFQWNDANRTKTFEQIYPLSVSVNYTTTTYDGTPTIVLDPADNGGDQHLVIDATAPNHIHLRTGGAIDNSSAELFLGGEDTHVRITDQSGSVEILGTDITISSYASPSSLNINTYSGAVVNSHRTSAYDAEDKVVATLGDIDESVANATGNLFQSVRFTPNFTATGLAFTGTDTAHPTYNSHYVKQGQLVSFWIAVDCSTVTSFGTGQLKIDLPFAPLAGTMNHFSGWVFVDETANPDMAGHIIVNADHLANTQTLDLHYIKQQGGANSPVMEAVLKQGTPVTLTALTNIYINGTYISA